MSAALQSSDLFPKVPRVSLSEVPEVSAYFKNTLRAMFGEDEDKVRSYVQEITQMSWTPEKMRERLAGIEDGEQLKSAMRRLRRDVMMSLVARDISGLANLEEVVTSMSDLAEITIDRTVSVYAKELAKRFGVPRSETGVPQDLIVIGMGKLGGRELNVSSDIDLIFFYDCDGECGPTAEYPNVRKIISNQEFYERLAKKVIPALSEITWEGFVFRVDMRLRPNGDSGPIVGSSDMLEEYLMTQGRDWERFAWLKGRVVNGPVFASEEDFNIQKKNINDIVRPFVYRKYLDFGAISSLTDLHAKIRLSTQKRALESLKEGQNIKLGRGGIREIEFIAQTFQVIRGGRNPFLRERSTLKALQALASENILAKDKAEMLSKIYVFLRNMEHALQYENDQQTQLFAADPEHRTRIAKMLGFTVEDLQKQLELSTEYVAARFDEIFQTKEEVSEEDWPLGWENGAPGALPGLAKVLERNGFKETEELGQLILNLMSLRALKLINAGARQRMITLVKNTVEGKNKPEHLKLISREELLRRYIKFYEVIAGRPTYVSLLLQYPLAAKRLGDVLGSGKWAAEYLNRHPLLLDELWDERLSQIDDYTPVDFSFYIERTRARLADIPEATLEIVMEEVWKTVPGRHIERPKFAIVAYGKLGGKELAYASDLDLVFLFEDDAQDAEKIYMRFARRLINWLTATTGSGVLFDVDMRLRPNGESGMLVSSVDSFEKYQKNEDGTGAWLWEHQALTRARYAAGDRDIGDKFEKIRIEILRRERNAGETKAEVLKMRQRMHDGHPNKTELFDVKHDEGGMVDVEFIVQYLVLQYSSKFPQLVNNFGNIKMLEMVSDAGLIRKIWRSRSPRFIANIAVFSTSSA